MVLVCSGPCRKYVPPRPFASGVLSCTSAAAYMEPFLHDILKFCMAQRKRSGSEFDSSVLPLLIVILVPVALILFVVYGTGIFSPATPAPAAQQTTQAAPAGPQYVTSASVSLDDASSLPTSVPSSQFIPFSFTLTNTGTSGGQVPYRVSVKWSTGEQDVIDENIVTLAAGASQSIPEQLKFEIATETAAVSLELPQGGQSVQFTLPASR